MNYPDESIFAEEIEIKDQTLSNPKYKVMIIDDEPDVHKVAIIALKNFKYNDKGLSFLSAYSVNSAEALLKEHPDTALIFLDVIMEEDDSGLKLIKYIRQTLNNHNVRIIMITGQPGEVPETDVVLHYDINDYREKRELTVDRLFTTIVSSLRSYEGIIKLDTANKLLSNLLDSFIKSTATAIDEKSPYTAGHIRRVAELTQAITQKLCDSKDEKWVDFNLSESEQNEIRIAAWMHDIGKITTPQHIVDKATKLETIVDKIELIYTRAEILKKEFENEFLKNKIELISSGQSHSSAPTDDEIKKIEDEFNLKIVDLDKDLQLLKNANTGGEFMEDIKISKIKEIALKTIKINGQDKQLLTSDEVENLCIRKGTLNDQEREIIQNHVKLTIKMLTQLPWPEELKRVPEFAGAHHETLDGKGYPNHIDDQSLPTQARIIAIADVFEALTAADRPYKKGKTLSEAFKILEYMIKDRHLDKDIIDLFVESGLVLEYAMKELHVEQLDDFIYNGVTYKTGASKINTN
ncbi:MAG: HD domain-containing protein, partial [Nitrospirae bacterium]|nr:HD domain-containing protein [Nitrospirota bacterium]